MPDSALNIAFYRFVDLERLPELRRELRALGSRLGLKGTIILSPEGINGFLAGPEAPVRELMSTLRSMPPFDGIEFKESRSSRVPFGRFLVKLKKEIIPFGKPEVRPARSTGRRLAARELASWLDSGKEVILLDTRNDYEISKGTFENARDLGLRRFRDFPGRLLEIPAEWREKPVVMFCTGGIRCEKATAYAALEGFRDVYQLEGGILKYFEEVGGRHYRGDCFVFDEREALDPSLKAPEK